MFTVVTQAQDTWAISVTQDLRLAFTDDDHGNTAPTLDVLAKIEYQTKQFKSGYVFFYPQAEFADLSGGYYKRYGLGFGYTFNTFSDLIDLSPSFNCGFINRWNNNSISAEFQLEGALKLSDKFSLVLLSTWTERTDIDRWRISGFAGVKYKL